ncbi:MAG: HAD-IIA family hydrolase [Armatimonadetes bacterium]|nr:HAD-IIA family hydrolase [Armatimonadota bacterium]
MEFTNSSVKDRLTYVFDLDGVIYRGVEVQPCAREVVTTLRNQGHAVRFYTNNAANSRQDYASKLGNMGIPTPIEHIMTSSYATALYFVEKKATGKTVYRVGEHGMEVEFEAVGMHVIYDQEEPDAQIDFVVAGLDRDFHYRKLARAQDAIFAGARFIATNEDPTFPMEGGALLPGGGCMVAAIRTATGTEPFLIGKPMTYAYDKILELTGTPPERSIMVGDRLDTDIAVGNRAGAETVLVLTGVTSREQAEGAMGDQRPDRIINTLAELL